MPLALTHHYRLQRSVVEYDAVLGHLEQVLKTFLMKPDCTKFYVGITGALEERRQQHERDPGRSGFTLMCTIYGEMANVVGDASFQNLEARAIARFRAGVVNPHTGKRLLCANAAGGSLEKRWLYVLVDKRDLAGIPLARPGEPAPDA